MSSVLVEIGIDSASDFFRKVAWSNHVAFDRQPSTIAALNAAWAYWHLHEWDFWEHQDPKLPRKKASDRLEEHAKQIVDDCRELGWLRDMTDAWKHRRLHREEVKVRSISPHTVGGGIGTAPIGTTPIGASTTQIVVDVDGVTHDLTTVLHKASLYWRGRLGID